MNHGSLFSGIGGFDLAAEWMGWENVFHCEWMEFPRKVLEYYWPDADSHIDICKTDFKKYANRIDILTGGFPCQPFSLAGKRKGTDDERYLWGEMLRAIREIKPTWVIAENVFGIVNIDGGLVFEQVCLDLENEGYEVQPFIIPAAAKNAPHRRDRCWFVAYSNRDGSNQCNGNDEINASKGRFDALGNAEQGNVNDNATDTESQPGEWLRPKQREISQQEQREFGRTCGEMGNRDATDTSSRGMERHRRESKRKQLQTAEFNQDNSKQFRRMDWEKFPTQSPICGGDDGLPTELDGITFSKWRNESIKGYGNAIVPQVAYQIFKSINEYESSRMVLSEGARLTQKPR
jgi:DNA (cytosine-5)-methyltransferase 1